MFAPFYPNPLGCFINNEPRYLENSISLTVKLSWILHIQMSPSYPNDMSLPEHNYGEVTMERELY